VFMVMSSQMRIPIWTKATGDVVAGRAAENGLRHTRLAWLCR
jgi:hypothetical protein